ncbi:DUF2793 domain-containing protein [Parvularcula sp. LCG005]|uniref:DUF2793 domain-containing protein n=1 Tax=Parvularcula sp. LCG005 TaxID=3078805 RepID=UPI00294367AC|nr:DUF2793 domain-containing protein [Parvularcula sp. LCG005]WOI54297.1 DUF2793 domain-containing protein [Parvularcula sp. LCG005]
MALTDIAVPVEYTFEDGVTVFDYPHRAALATDLIIEHVAGDGTRTDLQPSIDYIIRNVTGVGAEIEFIGDYQDGTRAIVSRASDRTQPVNLRDAKRGLALPAQDAVDRLMAIVQDVAVLADRGVKLPPEEYDRPLDLPAAALRAGRMMGFSDDGRQVALPLRVADMEPIARNVSQFLALASQLVPLLNIHAQLDDVEALAPLAEELAALGEINTLDALMCLADDRLMLTQLASDAGPLDALINQSLVRDGLAGLAHTAGLYEDEWPVDTYDLLSEDEGVFDPPTERPVADRGEVLTFGETVPPETPEIGDRHIPGAGATGDWTGADYQFAEWAIPEGGDTAQWLFTPPDDIERITVADEPGVQYVYDETAWILFEDGPLYIYPTTALKVYDEGQIV